MEQSEKMEMIQFDSLLGGKEELPDEVYLLKFAAARCKEVAAMSECILNPVSSKLVFQTLPTHMRRRIMSHNSKRLPRRLRSAYEAQLAKSGQPNKLKRPSRKYRRRPGNLLKEYNRRQRNNVWLETHIWHAKRFHMIQKWGYRLPQAPCDRAYRACYRATSKHCLLQDLSYYSILQITGNIEILSASFARFTSPHCGLSITAKAYTSGKRAGTAFVFHLDKYPNQCIGKVSFLWQSDITESTTKTVWIFVHPSFYKEFSNIVIECFNLDLVDNEEENYLPPLKKIKLAETPKEIAKSENVENTVTSNKIYRNNSNVILKDLKDCVNRFRLTGPLSHIILSRALTPIKTSSLISSKPDKANWFLKLCENKVEKSIHETQTDFWQKFKNLKSPSELPSNLIVGLNVNDPRLNFPQRRSKALPGDKLEFDVNDLVIMPCNLSHSNLWDEGVTRKISCHIKTTRDLNQLREEHGLVPGEYCPILDTIPGIPIILVQRPGSQDSQYKRIGYDSGWDVIIPKGYAMAFWLSMVLRGARVGGLRESTTTAYESGNCYVQPDTVSSQLEDFEISKSLLDKYFKLPPNKRVNFNKLSINSPFLCRWQILINDWSINSPPKNFFVLRDKFVLKSLQEMLINKKLVFPFNWDMNALVPICLASRRKGKLSDFALICLLGKGDTVSMKSCELVEPLRKDSNQKARQEQRSKHKIELAKLKRRRVRQKRKLQEKSEKYVEVPKQENSKLNAKFAAEMRELWLPSQINNVRYQCSRETIGYVTHGDFSFTEAKGYGVGYVALQSIKCLIERKEKDNLVLTRNSKSRQYRFANIKIITEN